MDHNGGGRRVKADETLVSILKVLKGQEGATLTEIANELDLAKSSVHDHLSTMLDHGFVSKFGTEYTLGLRFLDYGVAARNQRQVYEISQEHLDNLAEATGETALLIAEEGGEAVYLYRSASEQSFRSKIDVGQHTPLHHLAAGKAIMAFSSDERIESILDDAALSQFTSNTIVDREELFDELEAVRERGYALNLEESVRGLHAISTPILGNEDVVLGSVSVSGPAHRLTEDKLRGDVRQELMNTVNQIELDLRTEGWMRLSE